MDARGHVQLDRQTEREPRRRFPGPVLVSERSADGRWSAPRRLSGRRERTKDPVIAMNGRGDAGVAWTRIDERSRAGMDQAVGAVAAVRSADGR
jgi:hypothetical protein